MYYRKETPTQTAADALKQVSSGEIWGRTPRGGFEPTVQAYIGRLGARRGIEFTTSISPMGSPIEAKWYLTRTPGVQLRQSHGIDYACITADISNLQP